LLRTEEWNRGESWLFPRKGSQEVWFAKWGEPKWSDSCWLGKVDPDLSKSAWLTYQPEQLRGQEEEKQQFLEAEIGQPDAAWVEASFMASTGEATAPAGPLEEIPMTIEHSAVVALAGGHTEEEEADFSPAASVISVPDPQEEELLAQKRKRKLAAGLQQPPTRRRSKPTPVDQEYIGVAVEATQYRRSLRRKEAMRYYKFRRFTEKKDGICIKNIAERALSRPRRVVY
jgi:hypothetical protein